MPSKKKWYVNHQDVQYAFYPGQEVAIAPGVDPELLLEEGRTTRYSVQVLRQMKKIDAVIKLHSVYIDTDKQLMTETCLRDGVAYIPAQYLTPANVKQRIEYKSDIEKAMEGLVNSLIPVNELEEDDE